MIGAGAAADALKQGDVAAALQLLQAEVRNRPAEAGLRVFLFQLLCVMGQWDRALNQLKVASDLDAGTLAMAQTYREAIACEAVRTAVFAGRTSPMIFGEPDRWLALLIESLLVKARGDAAQAADLHARAFDEAPASSGTVDGRPFAWIADADARLGPVLEAVINGRYYWVPFARLTRVDIEAPTDLRDVVWMPAHLQFENGGEVVALLPTRYPGSESSTDDAVRLARKTIWEEAGEGEPIGFGQRVLATDGEETPLMDIRSLLLDAVPDEAAPDVAPDA
ncbi:MAG TPA: type VI secretion system accessory protein TagJ [Luteitalea sp.]|nr:type VI secretion system accessory protein TagJ [Luteitalea sp.]